MPMTRRFGDDQRAPRQLSLVLAALTVLVVLGIVAGLSYWRQTTSDFASAGSAAERLQPLSSAPQDGGVRRTVYVPIYSSLYLGRDIKHDTVELTSTLSVRNVSPRYPIVIESVRYYDSHGRAVRNHLENPAQLAALASVEFVVKEADRSGGPGANFLVSWSGPHGVDEPLIEAVMVGQMGNAGISFTSAGRVITNEPQ